MTYSELVLLEPRVADVVDTIKHVPAGREQYVKYGAVKRELFGLVGFGASVPALATPAAYDCAIQEAARRLGI